MEYNANLENTKKTLSEGGYTCVIAREEKILFTSKKGGVAPLVEFIKNIQSEGEYILADRVIGKAAALLCIKANIKFVYTSVISSSAKRVFETYKIQYTFDKEVPVIQNRTKTDLCPMEGLSAGVETPDVMYDRIILWLDAQKRT